MDMRLLTSPEDLRLYDAWVQSHPDGSLWQSLEWKRFQEALGREIRIYAAMVDGRIAASALVMIDRTTLGLSTWEIGRGPVVSVQWSVVSELLEKIIRDAKIDRSLSLYFSPITALATNHYPRTSSSRYVFPESTRILDLTLDDEHLLAQMRPKGRYNIRLAEKHGVQVELSPDIDAFSALARETAQRDGFRSTGGRTYLRFLECLPQSFLLLAYVPGHQKTASGGRLEKETGRRAERPIAGLLGVIWGSTGIYYYGASSHMHKELMAPYLLQWEAMQYCRAHGCTSYDLFGITPEGQPGHPWAGVSDFKAKFGGTVVTYPPEREIVLRPLAKTLLQLKRNILG